MSLIGTRRALVIAVEENKCCLDVSAESLQEKGVLVVRSYMEAIGLIAAHKAGVNPSCLTTDVASIRDLAIVRDSAASEAPRIQRA